MQWVKKNSHKTLLIKLFNLIKFYKFDKVAYESCIWNKMVCKRL